MKNNIIISGSIAIDTLFHHPDALAPILKDRETASIAFNVRSQDSFFGGCAGNILFSAALSIPSNSSKSSAPSPFVLLGFAGNDFGEYNEWLVKNGIDTSCVAVVKNAQTSHAYVMSDTNGQQLTFFYEGPGLARGECEPIVLKNLETVLPEAALIHVAPNSPWFMNLCIEQAKKHGVSYVFDPGQVINLFSKSEMHEILSNAVGAFFNEYEYDRAGEIMGITPEALLNADTALQFIVITKGEKGSEILLRGQEPIHIETLKAAVIDPTGCGDAYRGAFYATLYEALKTDLFSEQQKTREVFTLAGQSGSTLAARCLSVKGTQRHSI